MGPQVMAGLTLMAGAIAIGMLGGAARGGLLINQRPVGRAMAIILMAFCTGVSVMTVVVALIATTNGPRTPSVDAAWVPGLLAVAGATLGLVIARRAGEAAEPGVASIASTFALGLAMLGIILTAVRFTMAGRGHSAPPDLPYVGIGLLTAAMVLAMGVTGASALGRLADAADATVAMTVYRGQIIRAAMLEGVAVMGVVAAIVILFLA